jgi:hypothetical protein
MTYFTDEIRTIFRTKQQETILSGQELLAWHRNEILTRWIDPDFALFHTINEWVDKNYKEFCEKQSFKIEYQIKTHDKKTLRIGEGEISIISGENEFKYKFSFEGAWTGSSSRKKDIKYDLKELESFTKSNKIEIEKLKKELDIFYSRMMDNLGLK